MLDGQGARVGLITAASLHAPNMQACARDVMSPPVCCRPADDLRRATELLLASGLRKVPVLGERGELLELLDERALFEAHLARTERPTSS